jgi:hypothetical protein
MQDIASVHSEKGNQPVKLNLARALIGVVLLVNVQSALSFLIWPGAYAGGFELSGEVGDAMLRGMGVLFLMWNVPYAVALWHPIRHRVSLFEAVAMQTIGLVGETFIYTSLSAVHGMARLSLARFIIFDSLGLLLLVVAVWLTWERRFRTAS